MTSKLNEKDYKNQKEQLNSSFEDLSDDTSIFETTYEKVLSIINKVKAFIKKTSKSPQKLIDDLEWVIKVITNKSLYSYEVKKERLSSKNLRFSEFINFVTKYNEEVLEMNKRHILVSSLFNIGKKAEILLKPSLILKKILPEELKSMNYQEEKQKNQKKRNSINLIGNIILNMYHRASEKQKKENNGTEMKVNDKKDNNESGEKTKEENKEEKKENEGKENEENKKEDKTKLTVRDKIERIEKSERTRNYSSKNIIINITKKENRSKYKRTKTHKFSSKKIQTSDSNIGFSIDYKNNFRNKIGSTKNLTHKKDQSNVTKLTKGNGLTLSNFKNAIVKSYFTKNILSENMSKNETNYLIKDLTNDFNNLDISKKHLIPKEDNNFKATKPITSAKIKQMKTLYENKDVKKKIEKIELKEKKEKNEKKEKKEELSLKNLIEKYFEEIKRITDKDFNIFDFKKKVGYKNVLPIIGNIILKTLGLYDSKIISLKKIESFLYAVGNSYKESTLYHNSLHGADVAQSLCIYFINSKAEEICETTVLDLLGMVVSALGHDLGHPGYNNNFHINSSSDLAITYNDASCLENFHTSFLFKILRRDENNILERFNTQNYKSIRKRMISQILATDMARHAEVVSLIRAKIKACEDRHQKNFTLLSGNEKIKFEEQQIFLNYMIHAADLGHNTKKFEISLQWVELLSEEFWQQGDMEKSKGIPVSFLCDRDKIDIPNSQVGFLRGFIINTFDCLAAMFPPLKYVMDNAHNNINEWKKLADQHRKRGWTPKKELTDEKKDEKKM